MFQTLNSDIRLMGAYSRESAELYGLLNTRVGLSITPTWIKVPQYDKYFQGEKKMRKDKSTKVLSVDRGEKQKVFLF